MSKPRSKARAAARLAAVQALSDGYGVDRARTAAVGISRAPAGSGNEDAQYAEADIDFFDDMPVSMRGAQRLTR